MNNKTGIIYRSVAILFMGMTAAMNLLGGAGTSCVAFSSNIGYRMAFKELMDIRWLYQGFVITTVIIGLIGIWATIRLIRGGPNVYRNAMIILVLGTLIGGIHYFTSLTMRGKAAPANVKFYLNVITLAIFLLYNIPSIREKVDFSARRGNGKAEKAASAGMVSIVAGVITLTVFQWAAPSHSLNGENWVYVFYTPLMVTGTLLLAGGLGSLTWALRAIFKQEVAQNALDLSEIHQ